MLYKCCIYEQNRITSYTIVQNKIDKPRKKAGKEVINATGILIGLFFSTAGSPRTAPNISL